MTNAKRLLLALLGGRWPASGIEESQWPTIAEMAAAHRLQPLLAWRIEREGWAVPDTVAGPWRAARRNAAIAALAQQAALRLALDRLAASGIDAVALKGVALAWRHYPEPALRPMRDLDLLVPEARAREAAATLAGAGFIPEAAEPASLADEHQLPTQHHQNLGVTIEVHHRLGDPPHRRGYRVPHLAAEALLLRAGTVDCGGAAVRCPDPQDLAAHLIVHALYGHRLDCGPLVLADLHFLGATGAVDWERLRAHAEAQGWLRGADLLLALTARWLGPLPVAFVAPPESVLSAAEEALLPDRAARDHALALADLAAARSPGAFARSLARRLAPDAHVVADEAGGAPAWAFWPVWAFRRIARLHHDLADRRVAGEARAAAQVIRWLQG